MGDVESDIRVYTDAETLSQAAAEIFVETSRAAIRERGLCRICLSGGDLPRRMYAILAEKPQRELVDWQRLHFCWGDERCVPPEDLNSNYRTARELLLSNVPVPPENVHRVRTELEPELAAQDYAVTLGLMADPPLPWPRFDLVLLGVGSDGHTASLFPHSEVAAGASTLAVQLGDARPPGWRVTLTPAVFNSARRVVFLVHGAGKSAVVASVLYGVHQPDVLPAQAIRPESGELIWLLDSGAAG